MCVRLSEWPRGATPRLPPGAQQAGLDKLQPWLTAQFEERLVEPNSLLGQAIRYPLKHWEKLTLLLRKAGAPIDSNIVERAPKKAVAHRKNSLFYRTWNVAQMGARS